MTNRSLSTGKMRGMRNTSAHGVFNILALDHRQSFLKMLRPENTDTITYDEIVEVKSTFVRSVAPMVSAVLLDPIYDAAQTIMNGALPGAKGLLILVEESGYSGDATARRSSLLSGWSMAKSKRMARMPSSCWYTITRMQASWQYSRKRWWLR